MGVTEILEKAVAPSEKDAFHNLVANSAQHHNNNTWSTCRFDCVAKYLQEFYTQGRLGMATAKNFRAANKYAKAQFDAGFVRKGVASAVCCGIDHYELVSVKKTRVKGRSKQMFVVVCGDGTKTFGSKLRAEMFAMEQALQKQSSVSIRKVSVYDGEQDAVVFSVAKKKLKQVPKKIPRNARLVIYYAYLFYAALEC